MYGMNGARYRTILALIGSIALIGFGIEKQKEKDDKPKQS